jgi:tetratricopeptide (TPR) repeat protein
MLPSVHLDSPMGRALLALLLGTLLACGAHAPLPDRAVRLNRSGVEALSSGDWGTAETRLSLATQYSPNFTEAWVNRGILELKRGNFSKADEMLTKARELNADLPATHHAMGLLSEARGKSKDAESHYEQALQVDPGHNASRLNLARLRFAREATELARVGFLEATEVEPQNPKAWTGLVECLLRLGQHDAASRVLNHARAELGDAPALRLLVAREFLRTHQLSEAEQLLRTLTREPELETAAAAWAWLGVTRLMRGETQAAHQAAREALALEKNQPVARYVLAPLAANP